MEPNDGAGAGAGASVGADVSMGSGMSSIQLLLNARKNTSVALSVANGRKSPRPMDQPAIQPPSGQIPYTYDVDTVAVHALPDEVKPLLSFEEYRSTHMAAARDSAKVKSSRADIRESERLRWVRARDLAWKRLTKKILAERNRLTIKSKELAETLNGPKSGWPLR